MEPKVVDWVKESLQSGQQPSVILELLSDRYVGYAQMVNLMYDWNTFLGDEEIAIDREVRDHFKVTIVYVRASRYKFFIFFEFFCK